MLLLGTCPTLAISTNALNALGMGLSATFVLIGSNVVISLLGRVIPKSVRIPCYIVVIAGFVTVLDMLLEAFVSDIYAALGVFLPLIVVNCIVLGRAEMFASKNKVFDSLLDGVGMGLGFTGALLAMGCIRELLSDGTLFNLQLLPEGADTIRFFSTPAGGFFVFGCLIALIGALTKGRAPVKKGFDCAGCPSAALCAASYKCVEQEKAAAGHGVFPAAPPSDDAAPAEKEV